MFYVAAGRSCARAVHAAIHVAAESNPLNRISNNRNSRNVSTKPENLRLKQFARKENPLYLLP